MPSFLVRLFCCLCLLLAVPHLAAGAAMRSLYPSLKDDEEWLIPRTIEQNIPVFDSLEDALAHSVGERFLARRAAYGDTDALLVIERRNGLVRGHIAGDSEDDGWVRENDFMSLEAYLQEASQAMAKDGIPMVRVLYRGKLDDSSPENEVVMLTLPLVIGTCEVLVIRDANGTVLWSEEAPHPVEPDFVPVIPVSEHADNDQADNAENSDNADLAENASVSEGFSEELLDEDGEEVAFFALDLVADMDGDGRGEFIWTNTVEEDVINCVRRWDGKEFVTLVEDAYLGNNSADPDTYSFMNEDEVFYSDFGSDFPRLEGWAGVSEEGLPVANIAEHGQAVLKFSTDLETAHVVRWIPAADAVQNMR